MGYYNLIGTVQNTEAIGSADGNLAYAERPQWFKNWEATGLLQFQDKNGDGRIQYYNDKNPAFAAKAQEYGWQGSELFHKKGDKLAAGPDRDIMTLATPEIAQLPNWVIALVAAGGLAAALSTAAGLLMAISSAISHDLLKGMFMPGISEKSELLAARISMAGAIGVAGYLGLNPPGIIAEVVALAFGLAAASIFPTLLIGIFSKRVNNVGAVCGMLTGMIATLGYIFIYKGMFFIPGTNLYPNTAEYHFLGIVPHAFGCVAAVMNIVVAYVVSSLTAPTPQRVQDMVEALRMPAPSRG
jgi:cation/acetate symporter